MPETPKVEPGQRWADCDKRAAGRTIHVDSVTGRFAYVTDSRGRKSRIAIERMRPTSTGYRLVSDAPEEEG